MTPSELRIRCAEIEHWHDFKEGHPGCELNRPGLYGRNPNCAVEEFYYEVPPYDSSIDAINAAVLRLDEDMSWKFLIALSKLNPRGAAVWPAWTDQDVYFIATASALERATAFASIHS